MFVYVVVVLIIIIILLDKKENYYTVPYKTYNYAPQLDAEYTYQNPNIGGRIHDGFKYHSPSEWPLSSRDYSWDLVVPGLGKNRGIPTFEKNYV